MGLPAPYRQELTQEDLKQIAEDRRQDYKDTGLTAVLIAFIASSLFLKDTIPDVVFFTGFIVEAIIAVIWMLWFFERSSTRWKANDAIVKRAKERVTEKREGIEQGIEQRALEREKQETLQRKALEATRPYDGYVYLIREEGGKYKIGRTKDVPTRFNTLSIQIPQEIKVVWRIQCHDHKRAEEKLHRKYKFRRTKGEWFALSPEQVHEITQLTDGQLG
jgi:uncharacterized membrane protein YkvA (DUF1232 family)/predicted GIY-YIG superfamily endonuclease